MPGREARRRLVPLHPWLQTPESARRCTKSQRKEIKLRKKLGQGPREHICQRRNTSHVRNCDLLEAQVAWRTVWFLDVWVMAYLRAKAFCWVRIVSLGVYEDDRTRMIGRRCRGPLTSSCLNLMKHCSCFRLPGKGKMHGCPVVQLDEHSGCHAGSELRS